MPSVFVVSHVGLPDLQTAKPGWQDASPGKVNPDPILIQKGAQSVNRLYKMWYVGYQIYIKLV